MSQKSVPTTFRIHEDGDRSEAVCPFCGAPVWYRYAPAEEGGRSLPPEGGCLHFKGFYQAGRRVTDVDALFES